LDSKIYYQQTVYEEVQNPAEAQNIRLLSGVGDDPDNPGVPNQALADEISQTILDLQNQAASGSIDTSELTNATIEKQRSFLRSEFADGKDIKIAKKYTDSNGGFLQAGDPILVTIDVTNAGSAPLSGVIYLDSYEKSVFQPGENDSYAIYGGSGSMMGTGAFAAFTGSTFFDELATVVDHSLSAASGG
jgi:hypothetical protein